MDDLSPDLKTGAHANLREWSVETDLEEMGSEGVCTVQVHIV